MNPVGMGHGHIGKADNQPDQKREAAELKERFEILNSVQSLAKSLYTMGHSFAELCRDAAKNSFSEARGAGWILPDAEGQPGYQRDYAQQTDSGNLKGAEGADLHFTDRAGGAFGRCRQLFEGAGRPGNVDSHIRRERTQLKDSFDRLHRHHTQQQIAFLGVSGSQPEPVPVEFAPSPHLEIHQRSKYCEHKGSDEEFFLIHSLIRPERYSKLYCGETNCPASRLPVKTG